jgi:CDP-diacylglycerol--glycerol-3-phosphate 3-phosphatidyltransferase
VTGLRAIAAAEGVVIAASKLGKLKTISQIVAISALLLNDFPLSLLNITFGKYAIYVAVFFTLWSGVDYYLKARKSARIDLDE